MTWPRPNGSWRGERAAPAQAPRLWHPWRVRVKTKPIEGDAAQWDGTNAAEVQAVAGDAFKGTSGDDALILLRDDGLARVKPGWWVTRWDGVIVVVSEHAFAVWAQAA